MTTEQQAWELEKVRTQVRGLQALSLFQAAAILLAMLGLWVVGLRLMDAEKRVAVAESKIQSILP